MKDFEEFQPQDAEQFEELINQIILSILERSEHIRLQFGKLFYLAIKNQKITEKHFVNGFVINKFFCFEWLKSQFL